MKDQREERSSHLRKESLRFLLFDHLFLSHLSDDCHFAPRDVRGVLFYFLNFAKKFRQKLVHPRFQIKINHDTSVSQNLQNNAYVEPVRYLSNK